MAQQHTQAAGSSQPATVLAHSFHIFGWRIDLHRPATDADCWQCHGAKRWRPPYTASVIPCDLCTSAPISAANETTTASATSADNKA